MIRFNSHPPTAATTDVDPARIRWLAHDGPEHRSINGVAEVCASIIASNTSDMDEIMAIGEKIGEVMQSQPDPAHLGDGLDFVNRYKDVISTVMRTSFVRVL